MAGVHISILISQENIMFCPKCGVESRGTAKFCHKCGNSLHQDDHVPGPVADAGATISASASGVSADQRTSPVEAPNIGKSAPSTPDTVSEASPKIPDNIAGALCYILGWPTGIAFLYLGKGNAFVTFHAWQSILVFGAATIASIVYAVLPAVPPNGIQFWLIYLSQAILALLFVLLWIFLVVMAYLGRMYRLPLAGGLADKIANRV
jgi:uncharacterized membrane protein